MKTTGIVATGEEVMAPVLRPLAVELEGGTAGGQRGTNGVSLHSGVR